MPEKDKTCNTTVEFHASSPSPFLHHHEAINDTLDENNCFLHRGHLHKIRNPGLVVELKS